MQLNSSLQNSGRRLPRTAASRAAVSPLTQIATRLLKAWIAAILWLIVIRIESTSFFLRTTPADCYTLFCTICSGSRRRTSSP